MLTFDWKLRWLDMRVDLSRIAYCKLNCRALLRPSLGSEQQKKVLVWVKIFLFGYLMQKFALRCSILGYVHTAGKSGSNAIYRINQNFFSLGCSHYVFIVVYLTSVWTGLLQYVQNHATIPTVKSSFSVILHLSFPVAGRMSIWLHVKVAWMTICLFRQRSHRHISDTYWISVPHMNVDQIRIENVIFDVFFFFFSVQTAMQITNACHIWRKRLYSGHFCLLCEHLCCIIYWKSRILIIVYYLLGCFGSSLMTSVLLIL